MPSIDIPAASGVYRITCTVTGKFYIGSAINLRNRWYDHCKQLRRNVHHNSKLQRAWDKHGEQSFIFEVLELVLPMSLTMREQYWFNKLHPFGNKGFNIAPVAGSCFGRKLSAEHCEHMRLSRLGSKSSEETKRKMSKSQTGRTHRPETKEKISLAHLGYKHSAEAIARMKSVHLGKPGTFLGRNHSAETRAKMDIAHIGEMKTLIVTAPDGTEYVVHGIRKFCKEHHLDRRALKRVAQGTQHAHKGWKARFPDAS